MQIPYTKTTLGNGMKSEVAYDGFRRPTDIAHKTSGGTERAGMVVLNPSP